MSKNTRLLRRLDRTARIAILGIGDLGRHRPRHRPPTIDAALRRDEIAQFVIYYRAIDPLAPDEQSIGAAEDFFNVSRGWVYRCLEKVDPARLEIMKASAAAFATSVDFRRLQ
jgi:hypothetical protein